MNGKMALVLPTQKSLRGFSVAELAGIHDRLFVEIRRRGWHRVGALRRRAGLIEGELARRRPAAHAAWLAARIEYQGPLSVTAQCFFTSEGD